MFCKHCGGEIKDDAAFCSKCGKGIGDEKKSMVCPKCEGDLEEAYLMLGETYWSPEKGLIKGMSKRKRVKTERQTQAWRCESCRLILFSYQ